MDKFKLAVGVILVFFVGALAGSLGTGIYFKQRMGLFAGGGPPVRVRANILMKRLSDELDLTDVQRVEVEKIVNESQEKIFAVRRKVLPEIEVINEQSFAMIKDKLNSDQKEKLDVLYQKIKDLHDKFVIQLILSEKTSRHILAEMKDRLKLTKNQEAKVHKIMEASIEKRKKAIENYKEQDRPEISSLRLKMRELEKSVEKRLAEILTKKQMEEYRKIQEEERFEKRLRMSQHRFGGMK